MSTEKEVPERMTMEDMINNTRAQSNEKKDDFS